MNPMNPKSASALSWFALIIVGIGIIATAVEAQFFFSGVAAIIAFFPTVFARKKHQLFGCVVLVLSLVLLVDGYPKYIQSPYMQRAKTTQELNSIPPSTKTMVDK